MAFANLPSQIVNFLFAAGLNTRGDKRAKNPPQLDVCLDAEFDDTGGLRTRYPFAAMGASIFGGGTLSNVRRFAVNGNELLIFTKDAVYSWNAQLSKWVLKATYLAVETSEESTFVTTADQVDCDRAELDGTVVVTWVQRVAATSIGFVAAIDKTTGNVLMQPQQLPGSAARLRVTALSTKILLTFYDGIGGLYAYALDPAAPATALAGASTTVTNTNFGTYYDIVRIGSTDQAVFATRQNPTVAYWVGTITAGLVVAKSSKARTCDGPIAVSPAPNGTQVQVVRANGTNIQGDLITISTLADVYTAQAVGTAGSVPVNQIAAAHRSTQDSSQYRCYAFWSYAESGDTTTTFGSKYNWVDTGNTLGTQAVFVNHVGIASRAFEHDGHVFVWIAFAAASATTNSGGATAPQVFGTLQNTYFLYRDDALLVAKAADNEAGGYAFSTGALPGVAAIATNEFAWCGVERRILELGGNLSGYGARAPRTITFEFDSDNARRSARLGQVLYISGGEILQYDGAGLYEVGFHIYPWLLDLTDFAAGNLAAGSYGYKMTWRWDNAKGERDRSTTATAGLVTVAANRETSVIAWCASNITHKTANPAAAELWRTLKDPQDDSPYYLATQSDPTATANPNRYLANDPTAFALSVILDSYSDATLGVLESNPENGLVLENICPPPATIVMATETRLFLANVAGDVDRVWYSKQRGDSEVAAFHEELTIMIPPQGGAITGLSMLAGTLIVFREGAIFELPGDGFDNASGGQNYGPPRVLSLDVGAVNQESIAQVPDGLMFKCSKGWYLLTRAGSVQYIGGPVYAYDSEEPLAVNVMPAQHQVRILTANRMLVWDYLVNQWGEWTISGGLDACIWNGQHVYLTSSGPMVQQSTYTGVTYGIDVETAWIKVNDIQGRGIVRAIEALGEYRGGHSVRVRIARNYESDGAGGWSYFDDRTWTVTPTTVGGPEQLKIAPSIKRPIQAIKVRLSALAVDQVSAPSTEALKLTGISLAIADEGGLYSGLSASQKQ